MALKETTTYNTIQQKHNTHENSCGFQGFVIVSISCVCVQLCSPLEASGFEDGEKREKKEVELRESVILTDNTVCECSH